MIKIKNYQYKEYLNRRNQIKSMLVKDKGQKIDLN